jgi:glycosyltransferase involved in cell wall biosynthesis
MRIAIISTPFVAVPPKNYGGAELMLHELTEGLVRLGHDVTLFATGDSESSADLRWIYQEAQWPPHPLAETNHVAWSLQEAIARGADVVHVNSACGLAMARFAGGMPVVYTIHHELDPDLSAFYHFHPEIHYVAISADQASREKPLPNLTVIHHGLDPSTYEWTASPSDYVAFIGRFAEVKGPHTAIDVAARAGLPIRLAGAVHPVDREFGEREVAPRLPQPHVTYLGSVGRDRKIPLLRDARALLVPITWNEPFGLALIEAMLSGCPVVAFGRGSVPELVDEGVTGFIVEDDAAMAGTIRPGGPLDDFDRRRCRERAMERFGRDRMVRGYERLYQRVAAARLTGPRTVREVA